MRRDRGIPAVDLAERNAAQHRSPIRRARTQAQPPLRERDLMSEETVRKLRLLDAMYRANQARMRELADERGYVANSRDANDTAEPRSPNPVSPRTFQGIVLLQQIQAQHPNHPHIDEALRRAVSRPASSLVNPLDQASSTQRSTRLNASTHQDGVAQRPNLTPGAQEESAEQDENSIEEHQVSWVLRAPIGGDNEDNSERNPWTDEHIANLHQQLGIPSGQHAVVRRALQTRLTALQARLSGDSATNVSESQDAGVAAWDNLSSSVLNDPQAPSAGSSFASNSYSAAASASVFSQSNTARSTQSNSTVITPPEDDSDIDDVIYIRGNGRLIVNQAADENAATIANPQSSDLTERSTQIRANRGDVPSP